MKESQSFVLRLTLHNVDRLTWTDEEMQVLLNWMTQHGSTAASIRGLVASGKLPGRSEPGVQTRWHRHRREERARQLGQDAGGSGQSSLRSSGGESKRSQPSGQPAAPAKRAKHAPSLGAFGLASAVAALLPPESMS